VSTSEPHRAQALPSSAPIGVAVALAGAAMTSVQAGAALSTSLFRIVGPAGTAWLRLCWAAVILLVFARPRLAGRPAADLAVAATLGAISWTMTLCYFEAVNRLPLGTAAALEFLGPLTVAMLGLRRRADLVWPVCAAAGVVALTRPWTGDVDLVGVAFGLAAGGGWAGYIVLTQRVGDRFPGLQGLAVSMTSAALCTAVAGLPSVAAAISPDNAAQVVLVSLAVALLLPVLPYAFEMIALRRLTTAAFSTLMSLEPAIGTIIGLAVLAQHPTGAQIAGIALVTTAGLGAARRGGRPIG
jgi:inner membrane transporter RhtA